MATTTKDKIHEHFVKVVRRTLEGNCTEKTVEANVHSLLRAYFDKAYPHATVTLNTDRSTDGYLVIEPRQTILPLLATSEEAINPALATATGASQEERDNSPFSVLVEAKLHKQFSSYNYQTSDRHGGGQDVRQRAEVLAQVVYYLKAFQRDGERVPTAIVVADEDELFSLPLGYLEPYLAKSYPSDPEWKLPASSAASGNRELVEDLVKDTNLAQLHVEFILSDSFDAVHFCKLVDAHAHKATNLPTLPVDERTLQKAFLEFQRLAFGGKVVDTKVQASIFVRSLLGDETVIPLPHKNSLLLGERNSKGEVIYKEYPSPADLASGRVSFSMAGYDQFFTKWDRNHYTLEQRKSITAITDSLFEELDRRFTGDFWTPDIWVEEAHRLIERDLGEDWREKYVVWDPACGSKNLTRNYQFKELYCSTLHQEELAISEDYNPEATTFQYDFLNDDMELHALSEGLFGSKPLGEMTEEEKVAFLREQKGKWKLPDKLVEALVLNKPIVFFANPPYGQHTNTIKKEHKNLIADTTVKTYMKKNHVGSSASNELYTQFMYRVLLLCSTFDYTANACVFFFTKNFLTTDRFLAFNKKFSSYFSFVDGFMFNAGEFNGTSTAWSVMFSGWKSSPDAHYTNQQFAIKTRDSSNRIISNGLWTAKAVEKKDTLNTWMQQLRRTVQQETALGELVAFSNKLQEAESGTWIQPLPYQASGGYKISPSNLVRATVGFSVRKSWAAIIMAQKEGWIRDKDVFPAPTKAFQESEEWKPFTEDCVVYSLFASGSNQTALRNYAYGEEPDGSPKLWRVENQFFWRSKADMEALALKDGYPALQKDIMGTPEEAYLYQQLSTYDLSPEAEALLKAANDILEASFKYRQEYHLLYPEYHLNTWNSGWLQLHKLCYSRDALPAAKADPKLQELLKEFKAVRSKLGEKIAKRYSEDTGF